jgi:hypothetical protein
MIVPGSSIIICPGDSVAIGATVTGGTKPYHYRWEPPTGLSSPDSATPRASPSVTTPYRLTVTDANGCSTTSPPITVTVGSMLRTRIIATPSQQVCRGDSVTLDAGAFATYRWSTGDTTRSITVGDTGSYSVEITNGRGCSGGSDTVQVTFHAPPVVAIIGPEEVCANTTLEYMAQPDTAASYQWRIIGSSGRIPDDAEQKSINVAWGAEGVDTLVLLVRSLDGCVDSARLVVKVGTTLKPVIQPGPTAGFCDGGSVVLDAGGGYAIYQWSTGEISRRITVREAGRYAVRVADASGCGGVSDSVAVTIHASPQPIVDPAGPIMLCSGDSVRLRATSSYASYAWSTGDTTKTIVVRQSGLYRLMVVDASGCSGTSADVVVTVSSPPPPPVITIIGDTLISTPATSYQWYRDSLAIAGAIDQRYIRRQPGSYSVAITDGNECRSESEVVVIPGRVVWLDTVSAEVGERVRLRMWIDPPLDAMEGVSAYSVRLRVEPRELFGHGAHPPKFQSAGSSPTMAVGKEGGITIEQEAEERIDGAILFELEVEGLATAQPLNDVLIESVEVMGLGSVPIAGHGLVILSGCDIATGFGFGKRVRINSVAPNPVTGEATITYTAPAGSQPELILRDILGRASVRSVLSVSTGEPQTAVLNTTAAASGIYQLELHDKAERSAVPVVIVK